MTAPLQLLERADAQPGHIAAWVALSVLPGTESRWRSATTDHLAELAHMSARRLGPYLADLEGWGFIEIDREPGETTRYRLLIEPAPTATIVDPDTHESGFTAAARTRWLDRFPPTTRDAYARDFEQFARWYGADPIAATRADIQEWMSYLRSADRKSPTIRRKVSAISSFFEFCLSEDLVRRNPAAATRRPKEGNAARLGLTDDETRRLLAAANDDSLTAYTLIALLVTTGLRITEACNANLEDLGTDGGHTTIAVTRKGGRTSRVVVPPGALRAIQELAAGRTEGPAAPDENGRRLYRQKASKILERCATKAGIPAVSPHRLRHTAATLAIQRGATLEKVQAMLGHADPKTTQRYIASLDVFTDSPSYALDRDFLTHRPQPGDTQA